LWPETESYLDRRAVVKRLIAGGANPNLAAPGHKPALGWALGGSTIQIVETLISSGANVNVTIKTPYGGQENMLQAIYGYDARDEDRERSAKALLLLKAGIDPTKPHTKGILGEYLIEFGDSPEVVDLLLKKKLSVSEADSVGRTPLMNSIWRPYAFKKLLAQGAPVDAKDNRKNTALMLAAQSGSEESVRLLLSAGANRHAVNRDGNSALDLAKAAGHPEIVKLLTGN